MHFALFLFIAGVASATTPTLAPEAMEVLPEWDGLAPRHSFPPALIKHTQNLPLAMFTNVKRIVLRDSEDINTSSGFFFSLTQPDPPIIFVTPVHSLSDVSGPYNIRHITTRCVQAYSEPSFTAHHACSLPSNCGPSVNFKLTHNIFSNIFICVAGAAQPVMSLRIREFPLVMQQDGPLGGSRNFKFVDDGIAWATLGEGDNRFYSFSVLNLANAMTGSRLGLSEDSFTVHANDTVCVSNLVGDKVRFFRRLLNGDFRDNNTDHDVWSFRVQPTLPMRITRTAGSGRHLAYICTGDQNFSDYTTVIVNGRSVSVAVFPSFSLSTDCTKMFVTDTKFYCEETFNSSVPLCPEAYGLHEISSDQLASANNFTCVALRSFSFHPLDLVEETIEAIFNFALGKISDTLMDIVPIIIRLLKFLGRVLEKILIDIFEILAVNGLSEHFIIITSSFFFFSFNYGFYHSLFFTVLTYAAFIFVRFVFELL